MSSLYQEEIIAAAKNKQNYGQLAEPNAAASNYNASCGDKITVELKLNQRQNKITKLKWQGQGCVISQAAMSLLSGVVIGQPVTEVKTYNQDKMLELLHLEQISPNRRQCLMLGLATVQKALNLVN